MRVLLLAVEGTWLAREVPRHHSDLGTGVVSQNLHDRQREPVHSYYW